MTPPKLRKSPGPTQCLLFNLNSCSWCSFARQRKLLRYKLFGGARAQCPGASLGSLPPAPQWDRVPVTWLHLHVATGRCRVCFVKAPVCWYWCVVLHEGMRAARSTGGAVCPGEGCALCWHRPTLKVRRRASTTPGTSAAFAVSNKQSQSPLCKCKDATW